MPDVMFGHVADDDAVRTGLLQTGTCNLAVLPEAADTRDAESGPQEPAS